MAKSKKKQTEKQPEKITEEQYINRKKELELERLELQTELRKKEAQNFHFLNKRWDEFYKVSFDVNVFSQKELEYYQKEIKKLLKDKKTRKIHLSVEAFFL